MPMNIYEKKGYKDRDAYLEELSEEYDPLFVEMLSDALGPEEDFDGLVSELEAWSK